MPTISRDVTPLEYARNQRGLTQRELADMSGVTSQTIYRIEHRLHKPSIETLMKLAGALGVEWQELREREE